MLIPSLLMGNTAVLKLPAIGGLVHCLTATAFAKVTLTLTHTLTHTLAPTHTLTLTP